MWLPKQLAFCAVCSHMLIPGMSCTASSGELQWMDFSEAVWNDWFLQGSQESFPSFIRTENPHIKKRIICDIFPLLNYWIDIWPSMPSVLWSERWRIWSRHWEPPTPICLHRLQRNRRESKSPVICFKGRSRPQNIIQRGEINLVR